MTSEVEGAPRPDGWRMARLDEIAIWGSGGTPRRSESNYFGGGIPWVTISDLNDGQVSETSETLSEDGLNASSAKLVPPDAVMVALYGSIGKLGLSTKVVTTNQAIAYAIPDNASFHYLYLFHFLRSQRENLASLGTGVTQKNIYLGDLKAFQMPVAPRTEQTRIVEKLEELLSDLDAGVAELKAAQRKLAQYRQSLLKAAVEGALTADWRAARASSNEPQETGADLLQRILTERRARWETRQLAKFAEQGKTPPRGWQAKYPEPVAPDTNDLPVLPDGWVWATLDQLLVQLRSGTAETSGRDVTPHPVLKSSAVRQGFIDLSAVNFLNQAQCRSENYLEPGDLLITRLSGSVEYVGCAAIVGDLAPASLQYPDRIFCGKLAYPSPQLATHIVNRMRSPQARLRIEAAAKSTAGHKRISLSDLLPFPIPLPSLSEAILLDGLVRTRLRQTKGAEAAAEFSLKQSAAQRKNILKAAFAGQLVPQDPNDEPASVLLERIRAERAAPGASGKKRGRTPRTSA